jgi:integrase
MIVEPKQATKMLEALRPDDRALWALGFFAGLRRSETLGLRWDAVDLERRRLKVERTYHAETGKLREVTKTRAGARTVPMPLPLVAELEALERRGPFVIGGAEPGINQWNVVLRRAYTRWDNAKLARISYHASRHTYASWIIAAASRSGEHVDPLELCGLMGHTSIQMTMELYGHLLPDHLDRAQRHMDAFLEHQTV